MLPKESEIIRDNISNIFLALPEHFPRSYEELVVPHISWDMLISEEQELEPLKWLGFFRDAVSPHDGVVIIIVNAGGSFTFLATSARPTLDNTYIIILNIRNGSPRCPGIPRKKYRLKSGEDMKAGVASGHHSRCSKIDTDNEEVVPIKITSPFQSTYHRFQVP